MKIFENRGDVVEFSMTSNHPGNSVLNHLNFVNVLFRDTVQQTVAIVNSGTDDRASNRFSDFGCE